MWKNKQQSKHTYINDQSASKQEYNKSWFVIPDRQRSKQNFFTNFQLDKMTENAMLCYHKISLGNNNEIKSYKM